MRTGSHRDQDRPSLVRARAFCRRLVKAEARNFYYGFLLLPPRKRRAVYALYSFCRILDDALDLAADTGAEPGRVRDRFNRIIDGNGPLEPRDRLVSAALGEAVADFPVTSRQLNWIIDGVLMDCSVSRYRTMEEPRAYLFGVASAVGLACIEIFRYRDPAARSHAVYLGYAMQLTNIIRDVKEDYQRGRIYLPGEDLERFGVTEGDLGAETTSPQVRALLAFEAERARTYFRRAEELWPLLHRDSAACPYALSRIYGELLRTMERHDFTVLEQRFRLPAWRKILLMTRAAAAFAA